MFFTFFEEVLKTPSAEKIARCDMSRDIFLFFVWSGVSAILGPFYNITIGRIFVWQIFFWPEGVKNAQKLNPFLANARIYSHTVVAKGGCQRVLAAEAVTRAIINRKNHSKHVNPIKTFKNFRKYDPTMWQPT